MFIIMLQIEPVFKLNGTCNKKREAESMKMKDIDKMKALQDKGQTFRSISFDLQAVLNIPFAGDSQIYYRRKLSLFNFTIFDYSNSDGLYYLWDELNGRNGSSEIGSCLFEYLTKLPETVTHVTSYSDTCGGQNRNRYVSTLMLYEVNKIKNLQIVDLKYMESGHSYLEVDSIHSTYRKHKKIYELALLIEMARRTPIGLTKCSHEHFLMYWIWKISTQKL